MSYFKGPDIDSSLPDFQWNISVFKLLVEKLRKNGDAIAAVDGQTGKTASFQELLRDSTAIAAGLSSAGVTAGDYVIICCDKSIIAYSLLLGVIFTGATAIFYPIPHIDIISKLTYGHLIKAVVCDPQYYESLMKSVKTLKIMPTVVVTTDLEDKTLQLLLNCKNKFEVYDVKDVTKHIPFIFYSSGTTGDPKGILVTDLYVQLAAHTFYLGSKTYLTSSPMFWMSSLMSFMSSVFYNFQIIWSNSSNPKDNLQLLQQYKVEAWFVGTGTLSRYVNEPTLKDFDLSSVKTVRISGEYPVSSILNEFSTKVVKEGTRVENCVGATEAGLVATGTMKHDQKFNIGYAGPIFSGMEVKIVDEHGRVVPIGSVGDILLRTPVLTPGYWSKPDLTKEVIDEDGFFHTGDAGYFDKEGNIFFLGRMKDVISFKGNKISPADVEDILMSHEAVLDVAVVGKPHPADNQHVTAYVVLNQGSKVSEKDIEYFVNSKVDDYMKLKGGVHFLPAIPRTIIGKVLRKKLREM